VEYEECAIQDLGEWDSPMGQCIKWAAGTVLHDGVRGGGGAAVVPGGDDGLL
jgi:hypothetical protein